MEQENHDKKRIIEALIDEYGQSVNRLVYTYVKDHHLTEDLTQDIFVKCYQNLDQFSHQSNYSTWLYRIAVNHCKDYLKINASRRLKNAFLRKTMEVIVQQSPEELLVNKTRKTELLWHVLNLPEKYRAPIYFHYIEDRPIHEIEEILNLSKFTIYTRLRRGLEKIKKQYEMEGLNFDGYSKGIEGNY